MRRDKYWLYLGALDQIGLPALLLETKVKCEELNSTISVSIGEKGKAPPKEFIRQLAGVQILLEIVVQWLKEENHDQALWTEKFHQLGDLKLRVEAAKRSAEREQEKSEAS